MTAALAAALLAAFSQPVVPAPPRPPAPAVIRLAPLGPGEVLLELRGAATVTRPADTALLSIRLAGHGTTSEEARRGFNAQAGRVSALARAAGAGASDIAMLVEGSFRRDIDSRGPSGPAYAHHGEARIRLRAPERAAPLYAEAAGGTGLAAFGSIAYGLADDRATREEARRWAIAAADADAESYAAALGMRVARRLRVIEGVEEQPLALLADTQRHSPGDAMSLPPTVSISIRLGVDYALAPR